MARVKKPTLRKDRTGPSPVKVGVASAIVLLIVAYFGFTKALPFDHGFRLNAVFQSANSIKPGSPVRIAGVNVGKVTDVTGQDGTNAAVVTMEIEDQGLPIHKDAQLKIRPRIFLEGNYFVDLKPGTPAAPALQDNDTVAITQTATPVQLDQVLTALQQPTREDLQTLLQNLGGALNDKPTAAQDATQDPSVRGLTAGQALNQSLTYAPAALKNGSLVNQALLGRTPDDLSRLIASLGTVTGALGANETQLTDLVTNFNTTMAAFASQSANLSRSIALLGPTLTNADKALVSLNDSFPNTRAFALTIIPGVEQTQPTIDAALPWVAQATPLLGPDEFGGLIQNLQPTTANLAATTSAGINTFHQQDLFALCSYKVLLPTGDIKIQDGGFSSGVENYKEFWYSMPGLAGEGQNFDANGQFTRFQPGGGGYPIKTGPYFSSSGQHNYGNAIAPPLGTRPAWPGQGKTLPKVHTKPCYKQPIPDVNGAPVGPADGGAPGQLPGGPPGPPTRRSAVSTPLTSVPRTSTTPRRTTTAPRTTTTPAPSTTSTTVTTTPPVTTGKAGTP